jgi:hypothetical protein
MDLSEKKTTKRRPLMELIENEPFLQENDYQLQVSLLTVHLLMTNPDKQILDCQPQQQEAE